MSPLAIDGPLPAGCATARRFESDGVRRALRRRIAHLAQLLNNPP